MPGLLFVDLSALVLICLYIGESPLDIFHIRDGDGGKTAAGIGRCVYHGTLSKHCNPAVVPLEYEYMSICNVISAVRLGPGPPHRSRSALI